MTAAALLTTRAQAMARRALPGTVRVEARRALHWRRVGRLTTSITAAASNGNGDGATTRTTTAPAYYQGVYGPWTMEKADYVEVWAYRACLAGAGLSAAAAAAEMLLLGGGGGDGAAAAAAAPLPLLPLDALLAAGTLSLGAALFLVHVYVTPLKRALQLLWLAGALGCAWLFYTSSSPLSSSSSSSSSVLAVVAAHPWPGVPFALGPLAAAATGVAIKEGFCFRRPEAAALALLLPSLCLSHWLSAGWAPASAAVPFLGGGAALSGLALALGKVAQPPEGDVGDKSIFEFRKMSEGEQGQVLARLREADERALRSEAEALARERAGEQQRQR
jgi:uncharacterized integral membrane protein